MDRTTLSLDQIKSLLPGLPDRKGFSDRLYLCKTGPLTGQFAVDTIWDPAIDEQDGDILQHHALALGCAP